MVSNKNFVRQTTEYAEAVALMFYCLTHNLDFYYLISKRGVNDLNAFPDFVISNNKFLEVTRSLNDILGKRNMDNAKVFDSVNKQAAINEINHKNAMFELEGHPHNIDFYLFGDTLVSSTPLLNEDELVSLIVNNTMKKNCLISKKQSLTIFMLIYLLLVSTLFQQKA